MIRNTYAFITYRPCTYSSLHGGPLNRRFFRQNLVGTITPIELITIEHLIVAILLLPFLKIKNEFKDFDYKDWLALIFVAAGSSVGGILSFTTAFQYMNPAVVILLQKLQPIVTITLSALFLKERMSKSFLLLALIAIVSGYVLVFRWSTPTSIANLGNLNGVKYALLAVFFWGGGSVFGKRLLNKNWNHFSLTKWRYYFGALTALSLFAVLKDTKAPVIFTQLDKLPSIAYIALISGFIALWLFYKGLQNTKASVSSILELIFPLSSTLIVWLFLNKPLTTVQLVAGGILLLSVVFISRNSIKK